ncbi:MAG: respiratory nitrate reductase subunit gamma [Sandaracinaceae bacterium]|nr:respiratory nitrate reductase subunit gamma [Sandaracinaceae bacterium]
MVDTFLFAVFPYVAIVLLVVISIIRYRRHGFSFSSLSSQFLETRRLFWGSVPFHLGILGVLLGHLIGLLIPRQVQLWNAVPLRLYVLETTALVFGLMALVGLVGLMVRRFREKRLLVVHTWADKLLYLILATSIVTGLWIAMGYRWGSAWYTQVGTPYLWSIFTLQPDIAAITPLPWVVKIHIISAWSLIAVFSFTRMVHVLVAPLPYLWRPHQLVIWNRDRKSLRKAPTGEA